MLIDIGVNLTSSRFDNDRAEVVASAQQAGITKMLITGTNVDASEQAAQLCSQFSGLYSTAGVHPHDADNVPDDYVDRLKALLKHPKVKAVGECGLDFNRNFSSPENQQRVFAQQLQLAVEFNLPVFLHQRDAFTTWQQILSAYTPQLAGGVSHCFTGDKPQLKQCLDMGLYIGITGWITDPKRGTELYDIARYIPLDRVMVETDAPYLTPKNIRPKPKSSRNEPKYLHSVVDTLATAMQVDRDLLIEHATANSNRLFALAD
ncbi:TatD family hydrolase [Thalassotalea ponticola]|uniref:TatD family hydrolase n=1 Tax=Thalassotalea ponticola TaxID=1523392 RepID=UPI0025B28122|nr:TatD family hydrolase [Thalassotalea ponticola]MDN3652394.1 TatD family hydrolase [Thalassotalea ponticola]